MIFLFIVNTILVLSGVLALYLAWYGWRKSTIPGSRYFSWLMLAVAEYSLAVALELSSAGIPAKMFWSKVQFLGAAGVPMLWLLVALSFGQYHRFLTRRWVLFFCFFPAVSFLLALTNEWHLLVWPEVRLVNGRFGQVAVYEHGPAFWFAMACCELAVVLGYVALIGAAFRTPRHQRIQLFILAIAALPPWCVNILSLAGLFPLQGFGHTQFVFVLTGVLLAWSILRHGMLRIMPLAYEAVFRGMSEGVIMADALGHIVEINPAVGHILGLQREVIGKPLEGVLSQWPGLLRLKTGTIELESCPSGNPPAGSQWLEATASSMTDSQGQTIGFLLLVRDVTERKRMAEKYQMLFREMLDGFALHEILCDDQGAPVDYRFLAVNPAFERLTGLKAEAIVGKTVLEVLPNTEHEWIEKYGRVALTGESVFFEEYTRELNRYYEVKAFCPAPNQFASVFADITDRKQNEQRLTELRNALAVRVRELEEASAHIKTLQGIVPICMYCHKIRTDQESWQQLELYIQQHSEAQFSHGLCPDCMKKHFPKKNHER